MPKLLAFAPLLLCATVAAAFNVAHHGGINYKAPDAVAAPAVTQCEEDQPCWDCATMGNERCGDMPAGAFLWLLYGQPCELDNSFVQAVDSRYGC